MTKKTSRIPLLLFTLTVILSASAARGEPYGDVFIANTFTGGNQSIVGSSNCANGNSVLQWWDAGQNGLFTRSYNSAGIPSQRVERFVDPAGVPTTGIGCFATTSTAPDGSGNGVYVTIYDQSGNVVVPQFRVNETTSGEQRSPAVAINASGQFVVSWVNVPTNSAYVKLFQANGTAVAPAQLVLSSTNDFTAATVAINNQGAFVVAATVSITWPSNTNIYFRHYNSTGLASAPAFMANTTMSNLLLIDSIALDAAGNFLLVWDGRQTSNPAAQWIIYGRRFNANSAALGGEFQVSSTVWNILANVAMAANGAFTVTWHDYNQPSGQGQVLARSYDSSGAALGLPFTVSTATAMNNEWPYITGDSDGNTMIAWRQYDPVANNTDVAVRRYPPAGISVQTITDGATITSLSGASGSWQYFKVTVQPGHNTVNVSISGGVGDADLYVRYGALPSATGWDGRPFLNGNNEGVSMVNFPPGDWYIGVNGFAAYSALSLQVLSQ